MEDTLVELPEPVLLFEEEAEPPCDVEEDVPPVPPVAVALPPAPPAPPLAVLVLVFEELPLFFTPDVELEFEFEVELEFEFEVELEFEFEVVGPVVIVTGVEMVTGFEIEIGLTLPPFPP